MIIDGKIYSFQLNLPTLFKLTFKFEKMPLQHIPKQQNKICIKATCNYKHEADCKPFYLKLLAVKGGSNLLEVCAHNYILSNIHVCVLLGCSLDRT